MSVKKLAFEDVDWQTGEPEIHYYIIGSGAERIKAEISKDFMNVAYRCDTGKIVNGPDKGAYAAHIFPLTEEEGPSSEYSSVAYNIHFQPLA